jgi:hypothetical protein
MSRYSVFLISSLGNSGPHFRRRDVTQHLSPPNVATGRSSFAGFPALSIRQPWAELILMARKTIEVRTWTTDYRGLLVIHVGIRSDRELEAALGFLDLFHGGFVGVVKLQDVRPFDWDSWEALRSRHLSVGPMPAGAMAWHIGTPRRFERPIPGRGELGLFQPPAEVQSMLSGSQDGISGC